MQAVFQSFGPDLIRSGGAEGLAALRARLAAADLDGFILPRSDEYQNEYVPPSAERLAYLTGFTGSWGLAIVLPQTAATFSDGRYTVQLREQLDPALFVALNAIETPPEKWLAEAASPGMRIGYDPALHTPDGIKRFEKALGRAGAELIPVDANPVDAIWTGRPPAPSAPVILHPERLAGAAAADKLARVRAKLAELRVDALAVTDPHALAWIFNIRGGDVSHTPLPLGRALIPREGRPRLFIDGHKLSREVRETLSAIAEIDDPAGLEETLSLLGRAGAKVRFDAASASVRFVEALETAGGTPDVGTDPVALMKAVKNEAEIGGARAAHLRDGAAVTRFLAWLAREAPRGRITEIDAAIMLERLRIETGLLKDVSFPSISAAGPHAALPHYRVTEASNVPITPGLFLIDSGGQYEDGTTDITRTVAVGATTPEMRDRYTRVLKGMIAISRTVFPKGVSGAQIDAFARQALWNAGADFDHGTGHGVGSFLSVHEGPQRISKLGTTALEPGMILSNEPGYYREGAFGIRIENLVLVERRDIPGAEREMYGFETLTFVPIDTAPIERELLTADEIAWIDAYHAEVREKIGPLVDGETRLWLEEATRPLG
jgi:Xaa-Pro aminopeptidase